MKIKITKGLDLSKESISKLQESQMSHFKGGVEDSWGSCQNVSCTNSCNEASCNKEELELA